MPTWKSMLPVLANKSQVIDNDERWYWSFMDRFWCGFYLKAIWNAMNEVRYNKISWRGTQKIPKMCLKNKNGVHVFADELMSVREHHWQIYFFETWRRSLDLQTLPVTVELLFCFQNVALSISFLQNWVYSWRKKREFRRPKYQKPQALFWKRGINEQLCLLWELSSYRFLRSIPVKNRWISSVLEMARSFTHDAQLVQKTNATKQLWWHFYQPCELWLDLVTQFSTLHQ